MKVNQIINLDSKLSKYINNQEIGGKYYENIERKKKLEQRELVLNEFRKGEVRKDHYNGKNILTRLAIHIKYYSDRKMNEIVSLLKDIDIRPEFIIIEQQERRIEVGWFSQNNNVLLDENDYLRLIDEFIDYIINLNLDNWNIQIGMFYDDPIELTINEYEDLEIVKNPEFNKENFGLEGESQIYFEE